MRLVAGFVLALVLVVGCGKKQKMELPKSPEIAAPAPSPSPSASSEKPKGDLEVSGGEANLPPKETPPADGGRCLGRYASTSGGAITFYEDHTCKMEASGFVADRNECAFSMSEGEIRVTAKKKHVQTGSFAKNCATATFGGLAFTKAK